MSSPATDDYAFLKTPWKPIAELSAKNLTLLRSKIEAHDSIKDVDVDGTNDIGAIIKSNGSTQRDNIMEMSSVISTEIDNVIDYGAKVRTIFCGGDIPNTGIETLHQGVSDTEILGSAGLNEADFDDSIDHGAQMNGANITDNDDDTSELVDVKCMAVSTCVANSGDHRKVVSHIFGRNKSCTRDLPNNLWILWCRKHYQRFKYRAEDAEQWHTRQMDLVRQQLQIFEDWGQVRSWIVALRKGEYDTIVEENKKGETYTSYLASCWERFLVPYLGADKTFAKVHEVLDAIQSKFDEEEYKQRPKKLKTFPGIEFLPEIHKAKEAKKPATKNGEIIYKKITLDQPAFSRKTHANAQYIKDKAAKKSESSKNPKTSGTASKKTKSPDTDNHSVGPVPMKRETSTATDNGTINPANTKRNSADTTTTAAPSSKVTKRKSTTPVHKAPLAGQKDTQITERKSTSPVQNAPLADRKKTQPTKRRRLTRGYEKHGSDGDDTTFVEKQVEKEHTEDPTGLPQDHA